MPCLEIDLGDRLTSIDIDDLNVEGERHTRLTIRHVIADKFTGNPVRALSHLRRENAAVVAREEKRRVRIGSDTSEIGLVVSGKDGIEIAGLKIWLRCTVD